MRTWSKRLPGILLAAILLILALTLPASGTAEGLKEGSRGDEVLDLKVRLFDLGYLHSLKNANNRYTAETAEMVSEFQLFNGLPQTGEADAATLEMMNSPGAVKAPLPENRPLYNIDPDSVPGIIPDDLPPLDNQGYLAPGSSPYTYKNRGAGYWEYRSDSMKLTITRFYQAADEIEWFEAYVCYKDGGKPISVESRKSGTALESPLKLAEESGVVFAVNDDFCRYRARKNLRTGIVVRDGEVRANSTSPQKRSRIPSLEVLALFRDGTLKTFASDAHTGQEYLDMGVTDTWAFGPALVQEGEVPRYFYSKDYRSYREPRCAMGMVKPGEYCALIITGRKDGSRGATFGWMAEKMLAMGATEALNLDGGGTTALVFQGELLNRAENSKSIRSVSGLIGFK